MIGQGKDRPWALQKKESETIKIWRRWVGRTLGRADWGSTAGGRDWDERGGESWGRQWVRILWLPGSLGSLGSSGRSATERSREAGKDRAGQAWP